MKPMFKSSFNTNTNEKNTTGINHANNTLHENYPNNIKVPVKNNYLRMKKVIKSSFIFLSVFIAFLFIACDEKAFTSNVDCDKCYAEKPTMEKLYVYLTFNDSIDEIPLVIYSGDVEENKVYFVDTAWVENGNPYWVVVDVDKKLSVRAEYRLRGKTIYAVDRAKLVVKHVSDECDVDCYVVEKNHINLELKPEFLKK